MDSFYEADFSGQFNTKLSEKEEAEFIKWATETGRLKDVFDYDIRGYWKETKGKQLKEGEHATDKYKKPNHPTFSNQSVYNGATLPNTKIPVYGGVWDEQTKTFTPSETMLRFTVHPEMLKQYWNVGEKDSGWMLNLPTNTGLAK